MCNDSLNLNFLQIRVRDEICLISLKESYSKPQILEEYYKYTSVPTLVTGVCYLSESLEIFHLYEPKVGVPKSELPHLTPDLYFSKFLRCLLRLYVVPVLLEYLQTEERNV